MWAMGSARATRAGEPMILDRRQFLKSSLAGAVAAAWWMKIPSLAYAKGGGGERIPTEKGKFVFEKGFSDKAFRIAKGMHFHPLTKSRSEALAATGPPVFATRKCLARSDDINR